MKYLVFLFFLIFSLLSFAENQSENLSWKIKTRKNLDAIYNSLKESHPRVKEYSFYLGKAYGISLDKVKLVVSENDFNIVIKSFLDILNKSNVKVVKNKNSITPNSRFIIKQLPYGNYSLLIDLNSSK